MLKVFSQSMRAVLIFVSFVARVFAQPASYELFVDELERGDWLIQRAQRAQRDKRYDEAVRLYMGLVEKEPGKVYRLRKRYWIGLGEYVTRQIIGMGKEGIDAYRARYDTPFTLMYHKGKREGSLLLMEKAVRTYFLATGVSRAADALARVYFEEGRIEEAASLWQRLISYYPDLGGLRKGIIANLALCYRYIGDEGSLEMLASMLGSLDWRVKVADREPSIKELLKVPDRPAGYKRYPYRMPNIYRPQDLLARLSRSFRGYDRLWSKDIILGTPINVPRDAHLRLWQRSFIPAYAKVGDKEYVLYQDGYNVAAFDPGTGQVYWRWPKRPRPGLVRSDGYVLGCSVDKGFVYVNMCRRKRGPIRLYQQDPHILCAFDIKDGKLLWSTEKMRLKRHYRDLIKHQGAFCTPPAIRGDSLYVPVIISKGAEKELFIYCIQRQSGLPRWKRFICSARFGSRHPGTYCPIPQIRAYAQSIFVLTNFGVVAKLDAVCGDIIWIRGYAGRGRKQVRFFRPPNPALIHGGMLYALPQDFEPLIAMDLNGTKIKRLTRKKWSQGFRYMVGPVRGAEIYYKGRMHRLDALLLIGKRWQIIDLRDGRPLLKKNNSLGHISNLITGRPYLCDIFKDQPCILIPCRNAVRIVELLTLKVVNNLGSLGAGTVTACGDRLIVTGQQKVLVYADRRKGFIYKALQNPPHPDSPRPGNLSIGGLRLLKLLFENF